MELIKDLGMQYPNENSKSKARYGIYICPNCKDEFRTQIKSVKRGTSKQCKRCSARKAGLGNKSHLSHGGRYTKEYGIWRGMKNRCYNTSGQDYSNYGGRGITVCDEWKDDFICFQSWFNANNHREGLSIDRIDNNKGYSPDNCRLTSLEVQNSNRRMKKNGLQKYLGVRTLSNRHYATITVNKAVIKLGSYSTAEEAKDARNNYIKENNLPHTRS